MNGYNNDEIAKELERERERREQEKIKPKKIQTAQLMGAKLAWMFVAIAIDLATGYAIWQITRWWYGLLWIFGGAGGLMLSEWLWERIGNNDDQRRIAERGIKISAFAIALMALIAGVVYVLGYTQNAYIEALTVGAVVLLFCVNGYQAYLYHIIDDEYIERTEEARAEAENERRLRSIHRAARTVDARKRQRDLSEHYRREHGRALDAAMPDNYRSSAGGDGRSPEPEPTESRVDPF